MSLVCRKCITMAQQCHLQQKLYNKTKGYHPPTPSTHQLQD